MAGASCGFIALDQTLFSVVLIRHITAGHAPTIFYVATSLPPPGALPKDPTHAAMFCVKFGELCAGKGVRFEAGDDDMLIAELCR